MKFLFIVAIFLVQGLELFSQQDSTAFFAREDSEWYFKNENKKSDKAISNIYAFTGKDTALYDTVRKEFVVAREIVMHYLDSNKQVIGENAIYVLVIGGGSTIKSVYYWVEYSQRFRPMLDYSRGHSVSYYPFEFTFTINSLIDQDSVNINGLCLQNRLLFHSDNCFGDSLPLFELIGYLHYLFPVDTCLNDSLPYGRLLWYQDDTLGRFVPDSTEIRPCQNTGIKADNSSSGIVIFPNPVNNGPLSIKSEFRLEKVEVINQNGAVLLKAESQGNLISLSVNTLPPGIYYIRATTGKAVVMKKFIRQ